MIQRIQTIYLLLAAICGFGVLAMPFASTPATLPDSALFSDAVYNAQDNPGLLVLFGLAGLLALVAIFLYKNRPRQMMLTRIGLIADIVGLALTVLLFWRDLDALAQSQIQDGVGAYLPFGFILFALLALRGIRKDEELVRSADRLR